MPNNHLDELYLRYAALEGERATITASSAAREADASLRLAAIGREQARLRAELDATAPETTSAER